MAFFRGKTVFFYLKQRKESKKKTQTKQENKKIKGGFRAKWGGPLDHLTWPLNPPKQKTNKKTTKKNPKKTKAKKTRRV